MKEPRTEPSEGALSDIPLVTTLPLPESAWTFLTNHSHVLICLVQDPTVRLRDVADRVGITERAVQRIVTDLEEGGVLSRHKDGRRNVYEIHAKKPLRHSIEAHRTVEDLLTLLQNRRTETD